MHWTKAAIEELDRQIVKHKLQGDMPLLALTEKAVELEEGREVHAADVREAGDKYGASIAKACGVRQDPRWEKALKENELAK